MLNFEKFSAAVKECERMDMSSVKKKRKREQNLFFDLLKATDISQCDSVDDDMLLRIIDNTDEYLGGKSTETKKLEAFVDNMQHCTNIAVERVL